MKNLDNSSGSGHLNPVKKKDTSYQTTDYSNKKLKIADIKQFKAGFNFIDDTEAHQPVIIKTPKGKYCIDGYEKIKQAKDGGKTEVTCEVFSIEEHNEAELMLRKIAGRVKPAAGKARYPEVLLGAKKTTEKLNTGSVDVKMFSHGGARKGEEFNKNKVHNIDVLLSERLGKSVDTVRKYRKIYSDVNDATFEDLAKKDKDLDGKGADVKRPSKSFFERIQPSKNDFIDQLEASETWKNLDEIGQMKERIKEVSKKVLEAFDQYSKGKKITAFSAEKASEESKPAETDINKIFITFSSSIDDCKKATVTGKDKIVKILEVAEGLMKVARESKKKNTAIKIPKGPAREYTPLSLNPYTVCDHGCVYCYNDRWKKKGEKNKNLLQTSIPKNIPKPTAKKNVLEQIRQDAQRMKFLGINNKQVMLTTWGDPYCREESNLNLTTEVLKILLENEIPTAILTKGGTRCLKDLELFKQFGEGIKVGASFSFTNDVHSKHFEPTAALPQDRLDAMEKLNKAGIRTWASEEPVIDVTQSLEIIDITQSYVDEFKFGKLSGDTVEALVDGKFKFNLKPDYKLFLNEAVKKMREYGNDFYVKKDLLKCDPTIKLKPCEIDQDHLTLKKFK